MHNDQIGENRYLARRGTPEGLFPGWNLLNDAAAHLLSSDESFIQISSISRVALALSLSCQPFYLLSPIFTARDRVSMSYVIGTTSSFLPRIFIHRKCARNAPATVLLS